MAEHTTARQTLSFLRKRFEEAGIRLSGRHGQNFLIDLNLLDLLVDTAKIGPRDVVLEVGTGTGSLTALIAQRAGAVVTVEVDPHLYHLAAEELGDFSNVRMLQQDALKNKNTLDSRVLQAVRQELVAQPGRQLKLVANLPYNVGTPVISNLLSADVTPVSMTVTIQKELADRIAARPSTKDYGALSVWMQSQCRVELVRVMPPSVFWPRPKVHSAIVHVEIDEALRARIPDRPAFHEFVRTLFLHRRKFLRGVLVSAFKQSLGKAQIDSVLMELGFGETSRAEELDVEQFLALYRTVKERTAF